MTRLHAEISRSINFYRAQQAGTAPQRIFLCGGTANLPYLREFFAEKFQLPIEYFNPLKNVTVTGNVNVEEVVRNAHLLGELVGLGLRGANTCPMELNLRPTSVIKADQVASRRPYLIAAGACLLLALLGSWLYLRRANDIKSAALADVRARTQTMTGFETQNKSVTDEIAKTVQNAEPLLQTVDDRQFWTRVITEIHAALPEKYVWVTLLEPTFNGKPVAMGDPSKALVGNIPSAPPPSAAFGAPNPKPVVNATPSIDGVHIKGLYLDNPDADRIVVTFLNNLRKTDLFNLSKTDDKSVLLNRAGQNQQEWAFDYELQLTLKKPLATP